MIEEWKDVKGYEGLYQVSNFGNVRSLPRTKVRVDGIIRHDKGKLLPLSNSHGYTAVRLHKPHDFKGRLFRVHILVAGAFIPNPENKPFIDHINTIRDDNRVENLRWCTAKENSNNPISLERNRLSSRKRFDKPEERDKLSKARHKYFSIPENRERFKNRMNDPEVRARALANNPLKKKIRHYNSIGILVGEYESSQDASRRTGLSQSQISAYCIGKTMPRDKSLWFYLEDITDKSIVERISKISSTYSRGAIEMYTKDGKYLCTYISIRKASEATGISESAITNVVTGRAKTSGGYIWKRTV